MMIRKTKVTMWRHAGPHAHHAFNGRFLWERQNKPRLTEHTEEGHDCIPSRYPSAVVRTFQDAVRRCPSISMELDIMDGQPCITGTRIPVRSVLRAIEQYGSIRKAAKCYPHLTANQVEDALYFSQIVLELPGGIDETAIAP